jgi:hypothetical protein
MIDWIKQNKKFLSLTAIEKEVGMPPTTLIKAVEGTQKLPKKWASKLENFIKINLSWNPEK